MNAVFAGRMASIHPNASPNVTRHGASFQEGFTESTPLCPDTIVRRPRYGAASRTSDGAGCSRELICAADYDCDDNSGCEAPNYCHPSLNNTDLSGSRSFSEGTAILQYSKESANDFRCCPHGKNYNDCCGKNRSFVSSGNSTDSDKESLPGHCHGRGQPTVDRKARRRLIIASILCLFFMTGEVVGGYLADSLAIMTDAAHLLTDFASFMISLFALWVATRPSSKRMNFGWYRAEVIGALTSVLMIWVVTGVLVYLAVNRIVTKEYEINATIMLITSAAGVVINIIMGATLHTHGHSHEGTASHSHPNDLENGDHKEEHTGTNINVKAAFIHVVGDFIQSVGVFIAALIIYFKPTWGIVDPICTFLFSVLVLLTTFAIMRDTLMVLMEGLPKGVDFNDVHKTFFAIEGVVQVHNLRIWSLSMDKVALSAHVVVSPGTSPQEVLKKASEIVREKYRFFEMTLQIEDLKEEMTSCVECQGPN